MRLLHRLLRHLPSPATLQARSSHVCVIGSGPAGFYVAQHLLKLQPSLRVDIFEKLPVPFGLVRYGVAPDHPEVKNVINSFSAVLRNERVRFVGNVDVGAHIGIQQLTAHYAAVVLCYGATSDRLLEMENEHLITSAREFVGWYNGLPSNTKLPVNLSKTSHALIIGHGNVALDIARILLTDAHRLQGSDIAPYALEELARSAVKHVTIVGRRGVLHVAFTIKEFREMVKLAGVSWNIEGGGGGVIKTEDLPRPRKRLTELILNSAKENAPSPKGKHWSLKFLRSPVSVRKLPSGRLSLRFEVNRLEGDRALGTGQFEDIECDVAFRSIGYRGVKVFKDLPFDHVAGVVQNDGGRVVQGVYCSGWAGQGPRGVILSTMQNSFEVAKLVSQDLENGILDTHAKTGFDGLLDHCILDNVNYTTYDDYRKIAEAEEKTGRKITDVGEMMRLCRKM